jgi:ATP-dependent DNA helicase RecQ
MLACPADVPTLENFAYGDTPAHGAIQAVITELLAAGPAFDVSLPEMSGRHDVRQLVLRTILTYLELLGVLRQSTPFYAGYEAKPLVPLSQILGRFDGERRQFVAAIFAAAKKGRLWYSLDPTEVAAQLNSDRQRVVRALQYLEEHGSIELRASDLRLRFTRVDNGTTDAQTLIATLEQRFRRREDQEIARLQQVLALVEEKDCQTAALVGYFGERLAAPCGHCTSCQTGQARALPPVPPRPAIEQYIDRAVLAELCSAYPGALGDPRQQARFLCGLSSPAITQARLSRNQLYGVLEAHRFADVLTWCRDL